MGALEGGAGDGREGRPSASLKGPGPQVTLGRGGTSSAEGAPSPQEAPSFPPCSSSPAPAPLQGIHQGAGEGQVQGNLPEAAGEAAAGRGPPGLPELDHAGRGHGCGRLERRLEPWAEVGNPPELPSRSAPTGAPPHPTPAAAPGGPSGRNGITTLQIRKPGP